MKLKTTSTLVASLFAVTASASAAFAAEGKHWEFIVQNKSNSAAVEFRTQEDGEWSENWIDKRIEPGDEIKLDFETNEGNCSVRTQIRFVEGTYFDAPVDYCKATTLEIQDQTLIWK